MYKLRLMQIFDFLPYQDHSVQLNSYLPATTGPEILPKAAQR